MLRSNLASLRRFKGCYSKSWKCNMNESDYQSVKKNRCVSSLVMWMEEILQQLIYMVNIPLFTRIYTSQVHDFFHQQYHFQKRHAKKLPGEKPNRFHHTLKVNVVAAWHPKVLAEFRGRRHLQQITQRKLGSFGVLGYL